MMTNTRVAASDVADRETLNDFVDGGVNYLRTLATLPEIMMFRDRFQREGFWKSDSQFLMGTYRLDTTGWKGYAGWVNG